MMEITDKFKFYDVLSKVVKFEFETKSFLFPFKNFLCIVFKYYYVRVNVMHIK